MTGEPDPFQDTGPLVLEFVPDPMRPNSGPIRVALADLYARFRGHRP